jgi:hypothetical protein
MSRGRALFPMRLGRRAPPVAPVRGVRGGPRRAHQPDEPRPRLRRRPGRRVRRRRGMRGDVPRNVHGRRRGPARLRVGRGGGPGRGGARLWRRPGPVRAQNGPRGSARRLRRSAQNAVSGPVRVVRAAGPVRWSRPVPGPGPKELRGRRAERRVRVGQLVPSSRGALDASKEDRGRAGRRLARPGVLPRRASRGLGGAGAPPRERARGGLRRRAARDP